MSNLHVSAWRKSSRSANPNSNCVEVGCVHDVPWRKSSRSSVDSNCVEVADVRAHVAIRDSKTATGDDFPLLTVPRTDWTGLLSAIRTGHLDA